MAEYVSHAFGNSPIILTAPHGGLLEPEGITNRTTGCLENDDYTQELQQLVARYLAQLMPGRAPHAIAGLLHRRKVDFNRPQSTATDGDEKAIQVWKDYHQCIAQSIRAAVAEFGYCHVFDIHGQIHRPAIELSYGLNNILLRCNPDMDAVKEKCTLQGLLRHWTPSPNLENPGTAVRCCDCPNGFVEKSRLDNAIRGYHSLGHFLSVKGYPCVPCPELPHPCHTTEPHECFCSPEGTPIESEQTKRCEYYWGAYTVLNYGLRSNTGEGVSATQVEVCAEPRSTPEKMDIFAKHLAEAIVQFMGANYEGFEKLSKPA